ncbi:MAG: CHAT domain-containing protein [Candidatus Binatia bacterium]
MATIKIPGDKIALQTSPFAGERLEKKISVKEREAIRIEKSRAVDGTLLSLDLNENDPIEVELEGGVRLWTTWRDFRADFAVTTVRGAGDEYQSFPTEIEIAGPTRGLVGWAIKTLRVFDIDLSGMAVKSVAQWHEKRTVARPGLYQCAERGKLGRNPLKTLAAKNDKPLLIFLHGTGSSFAGGFKGVWEGEQSAVGESLLSTYDGHVYAFDHHTLTQSPLQNAIELLEALPTNAELHLVSHSRGGLIGELLCRASRQPTAGDTTPESFDERDFALFSGRTGDDETQQERPDDRKDLHELNRLLKTKKPRVTRFIRVACPTRGTTLASERLDRWLSLLINVLDLTGLASSSLAGAATDLLAAVLKEHTDPRTLPGLEAMMPTSPIVRMLNRPDIKVNADLTVIAGDTESDGLLGKLKLLALDRFYEGDHDLVVNTNAMIGGAPRAQGGRYFFDQGEKVNHFNYFSNERTARKLRDGLLSIDETGFAPLEAIVQEPIARAMRGKKGPQGPRPVVFVLPGIMGSNLSLKGNRIWVDYLDLALGRLEDLEITARKVEPDGPVDDYYGDLIDYLSATHDVEVFDFDWRLSLRDEAKRLAARVSEKCDDAERQQQPVRFLAHSMGGLVVRAMIAEHNDVWQRVCKHPGARFLMLGTPNNGSFSIARALVAQDKLVRQLALLDLMHSTKGLLKTISRFPGVLEMLPATRDTFDFFRFATWDQLAQVDATGWVRPLEEQLRAALETRRVLDRSPLDPQRMLYVAGHARITPMALEVDAAAEEGQRFRFLATPRGDGRVPWDTGIPAGVPVWYLDCEHGDLAAHEPAFPAFLELLQSGQTALLLQTPPAVARGAELVVLPRDMADVYPNEKDLLAAAVGASRRPTRRATLPRKQITVSVVHGHLGFTGNAVAVGHYQGDTIVSAEAALDRVLNGRLRERLQLGLYPGPLGSAEVFLNWEKKPGGAIVVGLGQVGTLTPGQLSAGVARGALLYAVACAEQTRQQNNGQLAEPVYVTISSLLIGTGAGGMSVEDSITAILRGVIRANQTLSRGKWEQEVTITTVEFLELWEDRAIQAAHVLPHIARDPFLDGVIQPQKGLRQTEGHFQRAMFEEPKEWYHRLQITAEPDGALRFNNLTDRARAEVLLQPTQRVLVDQFVARAVVDPRGNQQTARTLFELLIPNPLKEQTPNQERLALVLREETARYPWELLEDRNDSEGRPLAVRVGLVRQLETSEFRPNPVSPAQINALVVGDPHSQFVELRGAQQEAEQVANLLTRHGCAVSRHLRPPAQEVIEALFADDYRMLHFAGHGVYEYPCEPENRQKTDEPPPALCADGQKKKTVSGMVIGDGVFLTPAEVKQMRQVPELVFINCCHLGRIEGGRDTDRTTRHKLAANLAAEFIRMGVRCVVAAGWAVDDAAASTFARQFYALLLAGHPFGEAVLGARKHTYDSHGGVNTWGAYQCYGDPAWQLRTAGGQLLSQPREKPFVSSVEIVLAAENIVSQARMSAAEIPGLRTRLVELDRTLDDDWRRLARVQVAFGRAYGELGMFKEAIAHYQHAIRAESGGVSFAVVEQLVNLQCRYAVEQFYHAKPGEKANAQEQIVQARSWLEHLIALGNTFPAEDEKTPKPGETVERLALLGSAYKRLALVSSGPARREALAKMAASYDKAHQRALSQPGATDPYAALNLLPAKVILEGRASAGVQALLKQLKPVVAQRLGQSQDVWSLLTEPDYALATALAQGTVDKQKETIAEAYLAVRKRGGSAREFRSVLEHLDFLVEMWRSEMASAAGKRQGEALVAIRDQVQKMCAAEN